MPSSKIAFKYIENGIKVPTRLKLDFTFFFFFNLPLSLISYERVSALTCPAAAFVQLKRNNTKSKAALQAQQSRALKQKTIYFV